MGKWTIHENGSVIGVLKAKDGLGRVYQTNHNRYGGIQQTELPDLAKRLGLTHIIAEGDTAFASHIVDAVGYRVKGRLASQGKERLYAWVD